MEVGWHLRFSRADELAFLVQAKLAPNVEDAVFIAGGWTLVWEPGPEPARPEFCLARAMRARPHAIGPGR